MSAWWKNLHPAQEKPLKWTINLIFPLTITQIIITASLIIDLALKMQASKQFGELNRRSGDGC